MHRDHNSIVVRGVGRGSRVKHRSSVVVARPQQPVEASAILGSGGGDCSAAVSVDKHAARAVQWS